MQLSTFLHIIQMYVFAVSFCQFSAAISKLDEATNQRHQNSIKLSSEKDAARAEWAHEKTMQSNNKK